MAEVSGPASSPIIPALALDEMGTLHLFWGSGIVFQKGQSRPSEIVHRILREGSWQVVEGIPAVRRPISGFTVARGGMNGPHLLWGESEEHSPAFHHEVVYLQTWTKDGWAPREVVSDDNAVPGVWDRADLALVGNEPDDLDVFWIDWREEHFFVSLITGEGDVPKAFHRRKIGGRWTRPAKVQKRGRFDVDSISAVKSAEGNLRLFWAQSRSSNDADEHSGVFTAAYHQGKWQGSERVGANRNHDGTPSGVKAVDAICGRDGAVYVGWTSVRWSSPSARENPLEYRRLFEGQWSRSEMVSSRGSELAWVGDGTGARALLFQDYPETSRLLEEQLGHSLYIVPIVAGRLGERQQLAKDTVEGLFDAVITSDDKCHLVYVHSDEMGEVRLIHRTILLPRSVDE